MSERYGTTGGVFRDGRQVGAIHRWHLTTHSKPFLNTDTNGFQRAVFTGWSAEARRYRFVHQPDDKEYVFKFIQPGSWLEARGRVTGNPGIEGESLTIQGTEKPVQKKPEE